MRGSSGPRRWRSADQRLPSRGNPDPPICGGRCARARLSRQSWLREQHTSRQLTMRRANGPACTPGSVRGREPRGRSSLSATRCRAAPAAYPGTRRAASSSPVWPCSGRGLPCGSRHRDPGGLLHHPFTLTAAEAVAVCSLWHCLADHSGWVLPTALPCGARTFLGASGEPPRRDRPADPFAAPSLAAAPGCTARDQSLSAVCAMRTSSGKSIGKSPKSRRAADAAASCTACAASSA